DVTATVSLGVIGCPSVFSLSAFVPGVLRLHQLGASAEASVPVITAPRRYVISVPNVMKRNPISKPPRWTPKRERLLGTMPDTVVARKLRCSPFSVFNRRRKPKIPRYRGPWPP